MLVEQTAEAAVPGSDSASPSVTGMKGFTVLLCSVTFSLNIGIDWETSWGRTMD